jgi:hypothetical protein
VKQAIRRDFVCGVLLLCAVSKFSNLKDDFQKDTLLGCLSFFSSLLLFAVSVGEIVNHVRMTISEDAEDKALTSQKEKSS